MALTGLRTSVRRCHRLRGFHGLSFFGENDLTVEEIAAAAGAPHRWLRVSRYGLLKEAGYTLRREGPANHLVLKLGASPSDDELARLSRLFDAPRRNPHAV